MAGSHTLRPAAALAAAATAATVLLGPAPAAAGRPRPADPAPSAHPHLLSLPSNAAETGTVAALNTAGEVLGGVPPEGGYAQ
ncbi:hypothetical protein ACFV6D_02790 [Kitasatospora sp. NPDC059812]|uniref:hypothetical protein n=1 Tax=Kitasatospora sp. NPDC059812 TaxID=3346958 RepID=UPI0036692B06